MHCSLEAHCLNIAKILPYGHCQAGLAAKIESGYGYSAARPPGLEKAVSGKIKIRSAFEKADRNDSEAVAANN